MANSEAVNIALIFVMFMGISGFIYWVLDFFNIINFEWIRIVLSILIALLLGLIIYFRSKKIKNKK